MAILAPNVPTTPNWVPKPPEGPTALKPAHDTRPVLATAKNGGWSGGSWLPHGLGYGARNHGWGEQAAAAFYEKHGYQRNANYLVYPCASAGHALLLLLVVLAALPLLLYRGSCSRWTAFYHLATAYCALVALSLTVMLSGMANSVDTAVVLNGAAVSLLPFLQAELFAHVMTPGGDQAWSWPVVFSTVALMATLSAIDQWSTVAVFLIPSLQTSL